MLQKISDWFENRLSSLGELGQFIWEYRLWWLIPLALLLLIASVLIIVGHTTPLAPFIYPLL